MSAPAVKNNGTLFPPPPAGVRYFVPKNTQGTLAKFCSECGSHLDAHAYQWLTGGHGSIRACPPQTGLDRSIQQQQQAQQPPHHSVGGTSAQLNNQPRPYGSHSLHVHERDVDLSLTSSVVGDRKTVGNVAAHHRFYQQQQHQQQGQQPRDPYASEQRDMSGLPEPIPREGEDDGGHYSASDEQLYHRQQQQHQQQKHQQPLPGGDANAHFSRNCQLYDEAFSTPVPFGTDVDLVNPPQVAGPKGRRHLHQLTADERQAVAAQQQQQLFPRMSAVRERMERGNLAGAGGINVTQDAVRPDSCVHKSHIKTYRRDAQSKINGAAGLWD